MQADTIVPEPGNPKSFDRYMYVFNNPVRYTDSSGHRGWGAVAIWFGSMALKVVDYGWTAWDAWQSSRVLADNDSAPYEKVLAAANIGLALVLEAIEPDEFFIGAPIDDAARKALMKSAQEALEEGGPEALEKLLRESLGDYADDVLEKIDDYLGIGNVEFHENPGRILHIFQDKEGHMIQDTLENRAVLSDSVSWKYYRKTDEWGNLRFYRNLEDGTQAWVHCDLEGLLGLFVMAELILSQDNWITFGGENRDEN